MIINIYKDNRDPKTKVAFILKARENLEELRLLVRISKDIKVLSLKKFARIQTYTEPISKQLSSWYKYELKGTPLLGDTLKQCQN